MTTSPDSRSVHTDALDSLGTAPLPVEAARDAIHIAVEPVVAGQTLRPGEHVGFLPDGTVGIVDEPLGVVDPFVPRNVRTGERFWLCVYPRTITSLRHVWAHPAFDQQRTPHAGLLTQDWPPPPNLAGPMAVEARLPPEWPRPATSTAPPPTALAAVPPRAEQLAVTAYMDQLPPNDSTKRSVVWLREYAFNLGVSYDELMTGARDFLRDGSKSLIGEEGGVTTAEFWDHYETVSQVGVPHDRRRNFFRCSC